MAKVLDARHLPVIGVSVTAAAVRLPGALNDSLWGDEIASARAVVQPSLRGLLEQVEERESTPPLWYALAWGIHHAGVSLPHLRLLSVAFTAALAGLTVHYATRLIPSWAAIVAGLGVALGLQFVAHGQELRAYGLFVLVALLFAVTIEAALSEPRAVRLLALGACVAVGTLTHYFFFLTLATGVIALAIIRTSLQAKLRVLGALAVGTVPSLFWLSFGAHYRSEHTAWIGGFNPLKFSYIYSTFFADAGLLYHQAATVPARPLEITLRLSVLALAAFGCARLIRAGKRGCFCGLMTFGPVVLAALITLSGADVFDTRNLLATGPFAAIALAYILSLLPLLLRLAAIPLILALLTLSFLQVQAPPPYGRVAAALVDQGWRFDQPIALFGNVTAFPKPPEYVPPPLGWYLPGQRRLTLSGHSVRGCRSLFVVATTSAGRRVVQAFPREERVKVGSVLVGRLAPDMRLAARLHRLGAHFLRTRLHERCTPAPRLFNREARSSQRPEGLLRLLTFGVQWAVLGSNQ